MQHRGPQTWQAQRLHRNWYLPAAGLLVALTGLCINRSGRVDHDVWGGLIVWMGGGFSLLSLAGNVYRREVPARVSFDEQTLVVGQDAFERSRITSAKLIPKGSEQEVIFDGQRGLPRLLMGRKEARSLLDALGLGAGMRRTSFALVKTPRERFLFSFFLSFPLWFVWLASLRPGALENIPNIIAASGMLSLLVALPLAAFLWWVRGRAEIGADGLAIRWPWKTRYIPFRQIEDTGQDGNLIELSLSDGKLLKLCTPEEVINDDTYGSESQALLNHLKAALGLARRRAGQQAEAALPSLLGRNGRDARAWHQSLASLAQSSAYRSEHASPDLLASAVTDADLPPDVRAGAAVALLRAPSPEGRKAVRVAIEACADPDLLAALQELEEASSQQQQEAALRRFTR